MAPRSIPMPSKADVLEAAPEHESLGQLARRFGIKPGSFRNRLHLDGWFDEVSAALKAREPEQAVDHPERIVHQQLKDENKGLRKENRELAEKLASQHKFFEEVVEATKIEVTVPKFRTRRQSKAKPSNSILAPVFDQQFGQFVRPSDTPGGRGAFNETIFDERLSRWVNAVCEIAKSRAENYRIEELILVLGGDQVEGDEIFRGQSWQLEFGPPRQVWELASKLSAALRTVIRFAKEEIGVPYVALYGVPGNHGKVGGRQGGARPSDYSWDWLLQMMLFDDRLRAEPVDQFAIEPAGSLFFYCAGHEFQAIHGDEIRGWGGIPFYGLAKFDGRSMRLHNRMYRYLIMGHHHQPAEIPNGAGETLIQPDWVGANNLSKTMTAASRPGARLHFVSRKWGIDGSERIYFQEAEEAYAQSPIHGNAA